MQVQVFTCEILLKLDMCNEYLIIKSKTVWSETKQRAAM